MDCTSLRLGSAPASSSCSISRAACPASPPPSPASCVPSKKLVSSLSEGMRRSWDCAPAGANAECARLRRGHVPPVAPPPSSSPPTECDSRRPGGRRRSDVAGDPAPLVVPEAKDWERKWRGSCASAGSGMGATACCASAEAWSEAAACCRLSVRPSSRASESQSRSDASSAAASVPSASSRSWACWRWRSRRLIVSSPRDGCGAVWSRPSEARAADGSRAARAEGLWLGDGSMEEGNTTSAGVTSMPVSPPPVLAAM
mmetsp:Transcript_23541/g.63796  ORF Transcript_23541/g.63796 Transcript_23541/m.63796 type:complete len:258 (-) Transcript_23541:163-936(-)